MACGKGGFGLADPGPDPIPQLLGGGAGEGHHQDLPDVSAPFDQQADHEVGDGVGLSGPGAGLDQNNTLQRQPQCEWWFNHLSIMLGTLAMPGKKCI